MIQNKDLKRRIVEISYKLKIGHIGSCLTAVDIIEEIYKVKEPDEKFVLSAGHAHLAHLVVMEEHHLLPLQTVEGEAKRLIGSYGIHCDRQAGCDVSTGSLGHGIGIAAGMALADRSKNVYCLLSDGELAEGSVHEALRIKTELELENLKVYLNYNGYGAYKKINDIFPTVGIDEIRYTGEWDEEEAYPYPKWLQGQIAHYKVINEQEYNELMEILK